MILHACWPCCTTSHSQTVKVLIQVHRWQLYAQNCPIGRERIELIRCFIGATHKSMDFHKRCKLFNPLLLEKY